MLLTVCFSFSWIPQIIKNFLKMSQFLFVHVPFSQIKTYFNIGNHKIFTLLIS